jgi:flagellar basal-body rod protein FlgB
MDLSSISLFGALRGKMSWLSQRQTLLAENVANADTPGYAARDLKAPSFADLVSKSGSNLTAARTEFAHVPFKGGGSGGFRPQETADSPASISGNTVSIEEQMMEVTQTAMDYQMTVGVYRKGLSLIQTALGRGR